MYIHIYYVHDMYVHGIYKYNMYVHYMYVHNKYVQLLYNGDYRDSCGSKKKRTGKKRLTICKKRD